MVPVRYDDSGLATTDRNRFESGVRREVRGALSFYQPDRLTIVGMSRGTHALARLVCAGDFDLPGDTRLIWQSPAWASDDSWNGARSNKFQSLHIVGLADPLHEPERHSEVPGETLAIPGADHRFEVDLDVLATVEVWRLIAEAILRFAGRRD